MGLPAKTGFSKLFSELQKGGGKLPKQALYQTEICFNEIAAKAKHKIPPAHTINRGRGQEVLYTRNMKKAI